MTDAELLKRVTELIAQAEEEWTRLVATHYRARGTATPPAIWEIWAEVFLARLRSAGLRIVEADDSAP